MREILTIWCLLCMVNIAFGIECYVCERQENNDDKCTKTVHTCAPNQDTCQSVIMWRTPDYWTPHGERMYQISKGCSTSDSCKLQQDYITNHCKRDWYNDWSCIECCNGDLCNYYVTLGTGTVRASILTLALTFVSFLLWRFL